MLDALPYLAANALWLGSGARATQSFRRALSAPRRAQEARLRSLLRRNAGSDYGRRHGFAEIRSPREYQDAVRTYFTALHHKGEAWTQTRK